MTRLFDGTRRGFLKLGLSAMACTVVTPAFASPVRVNGLRHLDFHNLHTDERLVTSAKGRASYVKSYFFVRAVSKNTSLFSAPREKSKLCCTCVPALLPMLQRLSVTYWKDGVYSRPALAKVNNILRDFRTGHACTMHVGLMDLLYDLQNRLQNDNSLEIISGYRSPKTNMMLAGLSDGVAKHSYHTKGMAVDIRLSGTPLAKLHRTALTMRRGGVGYYPTSDFVHVDVGPVRKW